MAEALYRLGRLCATRAWRVIIAWGVIAVLAAVAFVLGSGTLSTAVSIPGTETARVTEELTYGRLLSQFRSQLTQIL